MWPSPYQREGFEQMDRGAATRRRAVGGVSRSLDSEDVKALKVLDGCTGIQDGWQRRSLSKRQGSPTRSLIRNSRPKPIRRDNVKYHKMFKAYLDNGEESLADLDPNTLSAHFLRRSIPKSALPVDSAETAHDCGEVAPHRFPNGLHHRPFTSDATGFLGDTSSFLRVSSLTPSPKKEYTVRQPPNTAPSSMQTLPYAFPARARGKRRTEPDVWRSPEEDDIEDVPVSSWTSFNSPPTSRLGSPLKPRMCHSPTPKQPISIDMHPANACLEPPSNSKMFPSFREGRLHSSRVHSVEAARRKPIESRDVHGVRMSNKGREQSWKSQPSYTTTPGHTPSPQVPGHPNSRPLSDTHPTPFPASNTVAQQNLRASYASGFDGSGKSTTWARPRGGGSLRRTGWPAVSVPSKPSVRRIQPHSYRSMQAQC